jgi:hypothetical protein
MGHSSEKLRYGQQCRKNNETNGNILLGQYFDTQESDHFIRENNARGEQELVGAWPIHHLSYLSSFFICVKSTIHLNNLQSILRRVVVLHQYPSPLLASGYFGDGQTRRKKDPPMT